MTSSAPTATSLLAAFRRRELSPLEALDAAAARIEATAGLGAFLTLCLEDARAEAERCERSYADGFERRPLAGVPVAVKDLFDTAGVRTTYGSGMFAEHVPPRDAAVVGRLKQAGAVVIGKTSLYEFAWGITSDNAHFGPCRNPWDERLVAGGSSGGSAVAVATGAAPLALGTDTGGSIRIPAALCGIVGFKPTYGRVSLDGVFPLSPSLDHAGPMAGSVEDAALLFDVMSGRPDPPRAGARSVAVCEDLMLADVSDDARRAFHTVVEALRDAGLEVVDVELPEATLIRPAFNAIQATEALDAHRRLGLYPERAGEYGPALLRRLEAAERIEDGEMREADRDRERVRRGFARLFEQADLLVTPVAGVPPVTLGEGRPAAEFRERVLPFTCPQDLAGLPACAVPAGRDAGGLPVGVQISGPPGADRTVLAAARAVTDRVVLA